MKHKKCLFKTVLTQYDSAFYFRLTLNETINCFLHFKNLAFKSFISAPLRTFSCFGVEHPDASFNFHLFSTLVFAIKSESWGIFLYVVSQLLIVGRNSRMKKLASIRGTSFVNHRKLDHEKKRETEVVSKDC